MNINQNSLEEENEQEIFPSALNDIDIQIKEIKKYSEIPEKFFNRKHGPIDFQSNVEPVEIFNLFFTQELFNEICFQTNLYQEQILKAENKINQFKEIKIGDIYRHLASHILMGIIRLPSYTDHFSTGILGWKVNEIIGLKKFEKVKRFFHLADNSKYDGSPLFKLAPFISLNVLWKKYYYPQKFLCLDESIIPFYGRHYLTNYNKCKPTKWGFKAFTLCDCNTYYCLDYRIYSKKPFSNFYKNKFKEFELNFKTALTLDMMGDYVDSNHSLIIDNFYTSIKLMGLLSTRSIYTTGTIN